MKRLIENPYLTKDTAWYIDTSIPDNMLVRLNGKAVSYKEYKEIRDEIIKAMKYKEFIKLKKSYKE